MAGAGDRRAWPEVALSSGGTLRASRPLVDSADRIVLAFGGSSARANSPRWSPSVTWLVEQLAEDEPSSIYLEVRYRDRRWSALESCIRDARAAICSVHAGAPVTLLGFSMGGGVAIAVSDDARVAGVVALAPWVPDSVPLSGLAGKRLAIVYGANDRYLPFLPGVPPSHSRLVRAAPDRDPHTPRTRPATARPRLARRDGAGRTRDRRHRGQSVTAALCRNPRR